VNNEPHHSNNHDMHRHTFFILCGYFEAAITVNSHLDFQTEAAISGNEQEWNRIPREMLSYDKYACIGYGWFGSYYKGHHDQLGPVTIKKTDLENMKR
jgi:hypothetical protein